MHFEQPIGFTIGGFVVGNSATMAGNSAVGSIVDVYYQGGLPYVTLEFMRPQQSDVPHGSNARRFDLPSTSITSMWEVGLQPDLDGFRLIGEGSRDGYPALVWGRAGVAAAGEPSFVTEARIYIDEQARQAALQAWYSIKEIAGDALPRLDRQVMA